MRRFFNLTGIQMNTALHSEALTGKLVVYSLFSTFFQNSQIHNGATTFYEYALKLSTN